MIQNIVLAALASWRYAYVITDDSIFAGTQEKILQKLFNKSLAQKPTRKNKLYLFSYIKLETLMNCIRCLTFWALLVLFIRNKNLQHNVVIVFGATWAMATILGILINRINNSEQNETTSDIIDPNN